MATKKKTDVAAAKADVKEVKKEEVKAPAAAVKKTEEKAPVAAKTVEKAPAAAKTAAKAPAKKAEAKVSVKIQFGGNEYDLDEVKAAVEADYKSKSKAAVKTLEIYVKPDEGIAYYVVNSDVCDQVHL